MLEDSQQRCGINTRRLTHDQQRGSGMLVIYVTTGVSSDTLSTRVSRWCMADRWTRNNVYDPRKSLF